MKFSAAIVVASSFVLGSSMAHANDMSAYLKQVQVQPSQKKIEADLQVTNLSDLGGNLRSAINDMSGERMSPATKVSRYKLNVDLDVGSILDSLIKTPLMARIRKGGSITYVQQFASAQEAANAKRLCPIGVPIVCEARALPTNAQAAKMLKANELVSFNFEKALIGGVEIEEFLTGEMGFGVRSGLILKGEFEAQISKLNANKVRLRILISKGSGNESRISASAPVEILSISTIGGIGIKPYANLKRDNLKGSITVTDLVFDLDDAQAAAAFNSVLSGAVSFIDLALPTPFFATDLGPIYKLAKADAMKPVEQRRVSLVSTMTGKFKHRLKERDLGIKAEILGVGIKIINKKKTTASNEINSQIVDKNGNKINSNLATSSKASGNLQLFFGLIGSKETKIGSTAVLSMLDDSNRATGEINFIVSQDLIDNKLKATEQKHALLLLQNRMTQNFAQRLSLAQRFDATEVRDAVISTRVIFSNRALVSLSGRSAAQLIAAAKSYAAGSPAWLDNREEDIEEMSALMAKGLSTANALNMRVQALTELRDNKAFRDIGTGLMMWLMNQAEVESTVAVKLYMRGIGRIDTELQVGTITNPEALAAAQLVDEELNSFGDVNTMTTLNATIIP